MSRSWKFRDAARAAFDVLKGFTGNVSRGHRGKRDEATGLPVIECMACGAPRGDMEAGRNRFERLRPIWEARDILAAALGIKDHEGEAAKDALFEKHGARP